MLYYFDDEGKNYNILLWDSSFAGLKQGWCCIFGGNLKNIQHFAQNCCIILSFAQYLQHAYELSMKNADEPDQML